MKSWFHFLGIHLSKWMWLLWPLRIIMRLVIKTQPDFSAPVLRKLSENNQVIYVLPVMHLADACALNFALSNLKCPLARFEPESTEKQKSSLLGIRQRPKLWLRRRSDYFSRILSRLLVKRKEKPDENKPIVLVPVSVFLGRRAVKGMKAFWLSFLFPDDPLSTSYQRLFAFVLHCRHVHVHFGEPVEVDAASGDELALARQLRRQILIEYYRERTNALGPSLYDFDSVSDWILKQPETKALFADAQGGPKKAQAKAAEYLKEIMANYDPGLVRVSEFLLDYLWTKLFKGIEVRNFDSVTKISKEGKVMWLPSHRSHLDYLLLSYVLTKRSLVAPHIMAGVNLNFWPMGPLFRRGGAFFTRRTFAGNRLYAHMFSQYVSFLLHHSFSLEYFQEGGRSRIGKLLQPKTGMTSICLHSLARSHDPSAFFIPVYFSYDKVMEDASYAKELAGEKKRNESVWQMVLGIKHLFSNYGKVVVSFGEPLRVGDLWQSFVSRLPENDKKDFPPLFQDLPEGIAARDSRLSRFVSFAAKRVNQEINAVAVASEGALLCSILTTARQTQIYKKDLQAQLFYLLRSFRSLAEKCGWKIETSLPIHLEHVSTEEQCEPYVKQLIQLGLQWKYFTPEENHYAMNPTKSLNVWWYRGTLFHLIAPFGMIAGMILYRQGKGPLSWRKIKADFAFLRDIWDEELYWPIRTPSDVIAEAVLANFVTLNVLQYNEQTDQLSVVPHSEKTALHFFADAIQTEREVYGIQLLTAKNLQKISGAFSKEELVRNAVKHHRAIYLRGVTREQASISKLFGNRTFDAFIKAGVFLPHENQTYVLNMASVSQIEECFDLTLWH